MKEFLKNNWFKLIIIFCLLLATFSFVYYFIISVSTNNIPIENEDPRSSKDLTKVIDSLYPDIINDYLGSHEGIVLQDFGQPSSKGDAVGFIDDSFWSENHVFYSYSLNDGSITFYLDKQTGNTSYIEIYLPKDSGAKVNVPALGDKGDGTKSIILGESTFGDIFNKNKGGDSLKKVETYQGGSAGNHYTNLDFYFGKYGEYHEFTFGVPGLYDQRINADYMVLKDVKPTKLRVR